MIPQVVLRPNKQGTFLSRHPWVLARSLRIPELPPDDGQVVDLMLPNGRWIARGIYNGRSHLRVRLYSWDPQQPLDDHFWRQRLERAIRLRSDLRYDDAEGAARLVFSEADGLSGLIVDRYGPYLVAQITALAMYQRLPVLLDFLEELLKPQGILLRIDRHIAQAEGLEPASGLMRGQEAPRDFAIREHGLLYQVDLSVGQKTGGYLDQRENHRVAAAYTLGRDVLDVCCYVGGFSLAASRLGQARQVLGIDASERAIHQATANAHANGIDNAQFQVGECFDTLEQFRQEGRKFGAVVLDPPRFAGGRQSIDQALRAYHRLNRLGVDLLEPSGILVTCSCSGRVSPHDFLKMLSGVAQKTGRDIQVLERRGASADHPVLIACPETEYLKCIICRVN